MQLGNAPGSACTHRVLPGRELKHPAHDFCARCAAGRIAPGDVLVGWASTASIFMRFRPKQGGRPCSWGIGVRPAVPLLTKLRSSDMDVMLDLNFFLWQLFFMARTEAQHGTALGGHLSKTP